METIERMEFLQREIALGYGLTEDERAELRKLESKYRWSAAREGAAK